jgi:hypothetical protein
MQIAYYYRKSVMDTPEIAPRHQGIRDLLSRLRTEGWIGEYVIQEAEVAFPTREAEEKLLSQLRDFAHRHKVRMAQEFGSWRYGFWHLPQQFLLVSEGDRLKEVFPCVMGSGDPIEPLNFLTEIAGARAWTVRSATRMEGRKCGGLINQILNDPNKLEPGLVVRGQNVQVSLDFRELAFIDLVFADCEGRKLLGEVKVGPDELDKAIGQMMRHRYLFAGQNHLEESFIRMGIACPYVPAQYRATYVGKNISWFELTNT